ncbi:uncharacterized protein LOC129592769 [Paramacrobiotus metropolitanus]|uniref:uncharacterized protein LOC129592769 n=1 Tax=Paramacrobiotus metropolitanus TaxID=2943436 RepID=UPI0024463D1A|nr:uncharacterized protein LOC129592769 [Paramacrobiotus metropolitanus]
MPASKASLSLGKFTLTKLFLIIGRINVAATAVNAVITLISKSYGPSTLVHHGTPISAAVSGALLVLAVHFQLKLPFRSWKCLRHLGCTDLLLVRGLLAVLATLGLLLVLRTFLFAFGNPGRRSPLDITAVMSQIRSKFMENGTRAPLTPEESSRTKATQDHYEEIINRFRNAFAKAASLRSVIVGFYGLSGLVFLSQSILAGVFWTCMAPFGEDYNEIADEEMGKTLDSHPSTALAPTGENCGECSKGSCLLIVLIAYKGALALYMMITIYYLIISI